MNRVSDIDNNPWSISRTCSFSFCVVPSIILFFCFDSQLFSFYFHSFTITWSIWSKYVLRLEKGWGFILHFNLKAYIDKFSIRFCTDITNFNCHHYPIGEWDSHAVWFCLWSVFCNSYIFCFKLLGIEIIKLFYESSGFGKWIIYLLNLIVPVK